MRRGEADWAVKRCTYLTTTDKAVFWALLHVADNDTCALPERFSPTMAELARWTSLGLSSVKRSVNHLVKHKWLARELGGGRGRKCRYQLAPGSPDLECRCEKGPRVTLLRAGKGSTLDQKGVHSDPIKGPNEHENPQVGPAFARREQGTGVVVLPPCDKCESTDTQLVGPYRLCREHAGVGWKDSA